MLTTGELSAVLAEAGQPSFRLRQIVEWLYKRDVDSYDEMTNLPKSLRAFLAEHAPLRKPSVVERHVSHDGTRKYLLRFPDTTCVETVAIPSRSSKERLTVCFSTQVGCAMACDFCATGHEGFTRNLGAGEMVRQVLIAQADMNRRVTNVVAMGQGEPFLNYEHTLSALRTMNASEGLGIGARKITVSTCGIKQGIERFSTEPEQFTLAVSLHAARQSVRDVLMPRVSSFPLSQLRASLLSYCEATNRRVTLEYVLLDDVNDSIADLQALLSFCDGLLCHVNLLPMNHVAGSPYRPSSPRTMDSWLEALSRRSIEATMRTSRGSDIEGACGQLKRSALQA